MSKDFNWVEERGKCSIAMEFEELKRQARKDANFRDKQLGEWAGIDLLNSSTDSFSVRRQEGGKKEQFVMFSLEPGCILITDKAANRDLKLTVHLDDLGECRFQIDGLGEFKRWQVLCRALERLFFVDEKQ